MSPSQPNGDRCQEGSEFELCDGEENEKREFQMEELPLQSLQGVEDRGVMRLHKDPGPKVRG